MRASEANGEEIIGTFGAATWRLLRCHASDWLVVLVLVVLDVVLNIIKPFHRYVGETTIGDLMYPLKSNTVPFWAVVVISVVGPLVFFIGHFFYKKDITDLHHAFLGWLLRTFLCNLEFKLQLPAGISNLCSPMVASYDRVLLTELCVFIGLFFSVLVTSVLTDAIKAAVGLARPDFFWRCFPDGNPVYNNITREVICHGETSVITEGHKSFPSGHTSWSFAGLGFLSLYIAGKLQLFDGRGHAAKSTLALLPLLCAALIAISRVDDYWHRWQDVIGGALLGLVIAALCYHQYFRPLYVSDSCRAYRSVPIADAYPILMNIFPWRQNSVRGGPAILWTGENGDSQRTILDSTGSGLVTNV